MDISQWPIGRILQLPDHVFGRRFPVMVCRRQGPEETGFDISEVALPDVAIVWEFHVWGNGVFGQEGVMRLALGDQLPADIAEMSLLEPLFMGLGRQGAEPRDINTNEDAGVAWSRLKVPVQAQGRRLVLELITPASMTVGVVVTIVVSSVPREVPDCLLSV